MDPSAGRIAPQTDGLEILHNSCHTTLTVAIVTFFSCCAPVGPQRHLVCLCMFLSHANISNSQQHSQQHIQFLWFVFHFLFVPYMHSHPIKPFVSLAKSSLNVAAGAGSVLYTSLHIHIFFHSCLVSYDHPFVYMYNLHNICIYYITYI